MAVEWRTIGFPHHLMRMQQGSMRLANIQITSGSQLANFVRATGLIAQRWVGKFDTVTMAREKWQEWESFIARLSGQAVLFEIFSPANDLPLGEGAGFALDNSAYPITGVTISGVSILTGATSAVVLQDQGRYAQSMLVDFGSDMASKTVLTQGDRFSVGGNLYLVTGPVTTDADGHARVPFRWRLHKAVREGDIVNFRKPSCRAMLQSGGEGDVSIDAALLGKSDIGFIEVPYVE